MNMVQAAMKSPILSKFPNFQSYNGQFSPKREDSPNNRLKGLRNITVTVSTKTVKKEEVSSRHLSMGSPPSGKASRSYSSDASDEDQHKAKKFKRADTKEPHLVG
jgi:hypothetical protein